MSDFDDSKDKVRRNLVSFSAALLIAQFIGIHIKDLEITPIGKITSKVDHPENIHIVLFVIWTYLAYRFAASIEFSLNAFTVISGKFQEIFNAKRKAVVDKTIIQALKGKKSLNIVTFMGGKDGALNSRIISEAIKKYSPRINILGKETDPQYEHSLDSIEIHLSFNSASSELKDKVMYDFQNELAFNIAPMTIIKNTTKFEVGFMADIRLSKWTLFCMKLETTINTVISPDFSEIVIGSVIGMAGGIAALTFS